MNREEAIKQLKEVQNFDQEMAHINADEIICELLISLGYEDVVKEFRVIDKWYA